MGRTGILWVMALLLGAMVAAHGAGTERYDYDPLGRLIRVIDEQGRVTEYVYDAAGNLLQVITGAGGAQAPAIKSVSPNTIRRGETKAIQIAGTGLTGAHISAADPALDISNLRTSATQVTFDLTAAVSAALGAQQLTLSNAGGTTTAGITVHLLLPTVLVDPTPLAIPPDKVPRQITIRLSSADTIGHILSLSASNTNISISPASVTILAGQTQVFATITGISGGQSTLRLASASLGNTLVPVFVTGEFAGISTSHAPPLGVVLEAPAGGTSTTFGPFASPVVGVVVGSFIRGGAPQNFTVGTGPTTLVISGEGLQAAQSVAIVPTTDVTVGALTVAQDGTSVSVPLTVGSNAPISPRKVVVTGPNGAFPVSSAEADRINVVRPVPVIVSIDPIFGTPGSVVTLTVRGSNLQDAQSVSLSPATGITVGSSPAVSTDGSVLTAAVSIAANAPVGQRTVIVTTPGGNSNAVSTAANTFSIVNEAVQTVTPIISPALGVVLQDGAPPVAAPSMVLAPLVGIAVGSVVKSMSPTVGIIGQTTTLTLQGNELQGLSAVQFVPGTGITPGVLSVAPDGLSATLPVTIDLNAPQTLRTVKVLKGTAVVPFASPEAGLFRVSAPAPVLDSISPIVLQVGQPAITLTMRGRNFQNASIVKTVPPDGVSISNPPAVSADNTELTVSISAAANAAIGPRAVVVVTPGGESSSTLMPQNTLRLTGAAGTSITPVISPALGVIKLDSAPPPTLEIGPIVAPALGVVLLDPTPPSPPSQTSFATNVGVVVGPVATSVAPTGFAPNTSGTLTIRGFALNGTTAVSINPATGVTLGALSVAPDGSQVSVPITIANGAPAAIREVRLQTAGDRTPFSDPAASRFTIGVGVPQFDSITPIVSAQGTTFTMTIRGSNFTGAIAVTATPAQGIAISNTVTVNATGTELTVNMVIAPNAPLGPRVIQIHVPGAASSTTAAPANTFNVISQ